MHAIKTDVHFDFDGALRTAREMWAMAGHMLWARARRVRAASEGQVQFSGQYADQFGARNGVENHNSDRIAERLRQDALHLAREWKKQMDNQNSRLYARHIEDLKEDRSFWEKTADVFNGFDAPPPPNGMSVPQPPSFAPTGTFKRY